MDLYDINIGKLGHFVPGSKATFSIDSVNLPDAWEYIYQNRDILLRVDQHGSVYAQAYPPTGIMLFRREPFQSYSSWLVWLRSDSLKCRAFTNFFRPTLAGGDPAAEPEFFNVTYTPTAAIYTVQHEGIRCETEIFTPAASPTICQRVSITNNRSDALSISAMPALRTYVNPAQLAPWDRAEWYLKTSFCREGAVGFSTQLLNMNSRVQDRRTAVLWSDAGAAAAEISYEKFVGQGDFASPQAVYDGSLRMPADAAKPWAVQDETNTLYGYPPVNALKYDYRLAPGETRSFRQVLSLLPPKQDGSMPTAAEARGPAKFLIENTCTAEKKSLAAAYEKLVTRRTMHTPDAALNRYTNEWLPLQLDWVCSLDRGWPSGMRGSRDSANDFTAMVPLDAAWSREIILTECSCQRHDGWFPRQYSASGRKGKHDLRGHRDGGVWVVELLYEYLCYTRDFGVLDEKVAWLDSDDEETILTHALRIIEFYLDPQNIGEHGLCKIGEGDWLDAVNAAGLEGRGESVMLTNQLIISLVQMGEIIDRLAALGKMPDGKAKKLAALYAAKAEELKSNLLKHALNSDGYFNSVFNDDGLWIFSNADPDGKRRIYGPANWWSISSGAARGELADKLISELANLKTSSGYYLYSPPLGEKPIAKVGRCASGDAPTGLWENGTAYNQGSHGFLGRALAVAGKGDMLYDVLITLLPYDQTKHPLASVMRPPYAVVNCWQEVPLFKYRGGLTFLTGSIAYAMRMIYSWMLGIRPTMDALAIDPCIPAGFKKLSAKFEYLGRSCELTISNPDGKQCGAASMTLNGKPVTRRITCPFSGRIMPVADDDMFAETNHIEIRM